MTHDHVDQLVRQANPVPDLSVLEPLDASRLLHAEHRRMDMQTDNRITVVREPNKARRGPLVAAAALVVIVIAALVVFRPTDDTPAASDEPAPGSAAAIETATAFLEAFGSLDVDRAASYLTQDVIDAEFDGSERMKLEFAFSQATGFQLLVGTCEAGEVTPEGVAVSCPYDYHALRSGEMGLGPFTGSRWDFVVRDGKIVSAAGHFEFMQNRFSDQVWEPFETWVSQTHPDDAAIMYTDASHTMQQITEESLPLWEQNTQEYAAQVAGQTAPGSTSGLPGGLPPVGATPSIPETGQLVASMWEHVGAPGSFGNGWLYLYDDGRLIWGRLDPKPTDGWLEQRLTPEGVELIRSEIIATGLFDPDQPPPEPRPWSPREANGGSVQVRNGDRLVYINYVVPELFARLADLWKWLPESAWVDQEPKAYVPSRYAACISEPFPPDSGPPRAEKHFADLPPESQNLLAGAPRLHIASLVDVDPAGFGLEQGSNEYCFDIASEKARTLAGTLDEAGLEFVPGLLAYVIATEDEGSSGWASGKSWSDEVFLDFTPMLPHGVPAFTGA